MKTDTKTLACMLRDIAYPLKEDGCEIFSDRCNLAADRLEELERELEQVKAVLADPLAVHLNMLRGTIQWTPANLRHLLGDGSAESELTSERALADRLADAVTDLRQLLKAHGQGCGTGREALASWQQARGKEA